MVKIDLKQLFLKRQIELMSKLDLKRTMIQHPGTKGDASELDWIGMLAVYLPARYCVEKAFVVDCYGELSEQQDVVIYDAQYSPALLKENGVLYVPAESVYAVLEVKQELSKPYITYAGEKIASVRKLHRTSTPIKHAGGEYPAKKHFRILGGLLALDSSWSPALGKPLEAALASLKPEERVDIGCALRDGSFEAAYRENGEVVLDKSQPDTALIFFFLRLVQRLQELGTVPAIDLEHYARAVESQETVDHDDT